MATRLATRREELIADRSLTGRALCAALSAATDELFGELFTDASAGTQRRRRRGAVALVAVGGYGRRELAPHSDIDVLLVHERRATGIDELATALWYPLWDSRLKLGHAVRSVDDHLAMADDDLQTATTLLSARHLAGDDELAMRLITEGRARWRKHSRRWLEALRSRVVERREQAGDVAYLLEPDLKDGHGGLRDVHTLWWAADADLPVPAGDFGLLAECYEFLLDVRVALHRVTGRPGDVLRLEDQDAVAAEAGAASADALMADIAAAGRTIVWIANGVWRNLNRHQIGREEHVAPGVVVIDREVELAGAASVRDDPAIVLRLARAAAQRDVPLGRATLDRLAEEVDPADWNERWPDGALGELIDLLRQGHRSIDVLESLDQKGLLVRLLPEWSTVRSRPQRNAYHRFTVDRHLWETAANAAAFTDRVRRPDLLLLGALFHDLGKGSPGDHTPAGMDLVRRIGPRLGVDRADVETLVCLVEHHLLLPDVAVRRDLSDPATLRLVSTAVGGAETLDLLYALTEADATATGPSAWGTWKQQLVAELVKRTAETLDGADPLMAAAGRRAFPDDAALGAMAIGRFEVQVEPDAETADGTERITVVCPDRPGTFARIAGALTLRGLDVLTAWAHSGDVGAGPMAASRFRVMPPRADLDWEPVIEDVRRAVAGELAIDARLAERARTYRRRRATQAAPAEPPAVWFHDEGSDMATVIEVRAPNQLGVLHRIARALADLGLDIRHATVQSLGEDVFDTFYVRNAAGGLVSDSFHRGEIQRAVLHAVS
jgi:[protein-PII] uridylyltransferase